MCSLRIESGVKISERYGLMVEELPQDIRNKLRQENSGDWRGYIQPPKMLSEAPAFQVAEAMGRVFALFKMESALRTLHIDGQDRRCVLLRLSSLELKPQLVQLLESVCEIAARGGWRSSQDLLPPALELSASAFEQRLADLRSKLSVNPPAPGLHGSS